MSEMTDRERALIDAPVKTAQYRGKRLAGGDRWVFYLPRDGRRCTTWSEEQCRSAIEKGLADEQEVKG